MKVRKGKKENLKNEWNKNSNLLKEINGRKKRKPGKVDEQQRKM